MLKSTWIIICTEKGYWGTPRPSFEPMSSHQRGWPANNALETAFTRCKIYFGSVIGKVSDRREIGLGMPKMHFRRSAFG